MRKEQLICLCLAMLLVSTTLMLSSCKKDPKDKDPKEALVNTRWKMATDLTGLDIDKEIGEVSGGELRFTSQTEGELTAAIKGTKLTLSVTYSYDATQKAYPATVKIGDDINQFILKVNWDTNILIAYELEAGVVIPKPIMFFTLVK
ncbi:hypothetical protein PORUE0001_0480 [Porphyromonas uenonis 60-3]|uniref:Lipocalin-like domain-containing protein n=1 Tax=Porphyromonas uenonis 60-3 TaxID=596327 RepID=C2MBQ9_9PORP|nr:hypothetical protein [Porphyromonas uenonis]EEK16850.1 hypothetical protein PORUE0001_0480 [Porphyromonas uenonis 60-3]